MTVCIQEALDLIYKHVNKLATQIIPIESALKCIIAEDIVASHNLPPFDNSAMDGYGVRCEDAGKSLEISHTIFAGDKNDIELPSQHACKIMTGAKIPSGCEAIVPFENASFENNTVALPKSIQPSKHIRLTGEDIKSGDTLITKGTFLNAYKITLLASQGITHVLVYHQPRVAVFASGNELKMHFESLQPHQIYNTNTPTIIARLKELGCMVTFIKTAIDSLNEIQSIIKNILNFDFIITSGGASKGEADFMKSAFSYFNMEVLFDKLDIKPGKPTAFGKINNTYVLNLPGNPLAASLNFELFAKATIFALNGREDKFLNSIMTFIDEDIMVNSKRPTLLPGYFDGTSFKTTKQHSAGMIKPLAMSNGFIIVDKDIEILQSNQRVKFIPITYDFTSKIKIDFTTTK